MASIFGAQSSEAAWHSGPNGRGTLNIIETSVITTGLCVWTAVHMNISEEEIGRKKNVILRLLEKSSLRVGWVLIGLLAPEMVCTCLIPGRHHIIDELTICVSLPGTPGNRDKRPSG